MSGKKGKPQANESKFITVKGAMQLTALSEASIYREIASGRLQKFKVGRRTLLSREQVEQLPRLA